MRLSARTIKNFNNVNSFDYSTEWNIRAGEANTLYFQLVDLDQDGLRYMPTNASCSVQLTFPALNPLNVIVKPATQADPLDRSVWKVSLSDTEVPSSGNVQLSLTEGGVVKKASLLDAIVVEKINNGGC
jgi:hypothetical protein